MRKIVSVAFICLGLAACTEGTQQTEILSGNGLKERLSDTRLNLVVTNSTAPQNIYWTLHESGLMEWKGQPARSTYGWRITGNRICTAIYVSRKKVEGSEKCGTVSIQGDKITLRQKNAKFGPGSILAGTIHPF